MTQPPRLYDEWIKYRDAGGELPYEEWLFALTSTPQPAEVYKVDTAWRKYRDAGGWLPYEEWLAAGQPTVEEDREREAFFYRLEAYLAPFVQTGAITEEQKDSIVDDQYDKATAWGKYKGEDPVPFHELDYYNKVTQYIKGLPEEAQKRIEALQRETEKRQREAEREAQEAQQEAETVARQRRALPLGARGDYAEQVGAAYDAIRNLRIQMEAAPDYLQDEIISQINALQQAIPKIRGLARTQARIETAKEEPPPEPEPEPGTMAQAFAEKYGLSPQQAEQTGLRYATSPDRGEFQNLTTRQKQELAWVGMEVTEEAPPPPKPPFEPPEFEELDESGSPVWKSWFARRFPKIVEEFGEKPIEKRRGEKGRQTWADFLEEERKRLRTEFSKQSFARRGLSPRRFAPGIKTVQF